MKVRRGGEMCEQQVHVCVFRTGTSVSRAKFVQYLE